MTKTRAAARGFSLMELIIVVAIIAVLAMLAVPNLMAIVPQAQMRGSARGVASLLQQARIMAENTQKPTRLALDCRPSSGAPPCEARLYSAAFKPNGTLDKWVEAPFAKRELGRTVRVAAGASTPVTGSPANVFWAVYMPDGEVRASHEPWRLIFSSTNSRVTPWELVVNKASGRPTLRGLQ